MVNALIEAAKKFFGTIQGKTKSSKAIFTIFAILITTGILGWLVYSNKDVLLEYSWDLNPLYLLFSFLVYFCILFLTVFTWANIMEKLGRKISIVKHFKSFCISALGKRLPGTLWYIAWRAQMYKDDFSVKLVTVASGIEMAVTIVAAVIICVLFSIPLVIKYQWSIWLILLMVVLSMIVIHPRFIQWLLKKLKIEANKIKYTDLLRWIGLYAIIWILVGSLLFTISNIFTSSPLTSISYFIGSTALTGVLSRLLFFSPSTFGFNEVSLSLLLSSIMPSSIAVIVAIANRIIIITFEIFWALVSLFIEKVVEKSQ